MNQCDGCRAGIPVDSRGIHRMGGTGRYPDLMYCTKDRYNKKKNATGIFGKSKSTEVSGK